MQGLRAIPTTYKGIKFLSRLEARWAVFFDVLELGFEYEKEGYDLGDGVLYLPDFYIPDLDCYIEIKGRKPDRFEQDKAVRLYRAARCPVHIFAGPVPEPGIEYWKDSDFEIFTFDYRSRDLFTNQKYLKDIYAINQCPKCETIGFSVRGRVDMLPCGDGPITERLSPRVVKAYKYARAARFEHV